MMRQLFMGTGLFLWCLFMLPGCGQKDTLHYNTESLLFNAILIPAQGQALGTSIQEVSLALEEMESLDSQWKRAVQTAGESLLTSDSRLKIRVVSGDEQTFPGVGYLANFSIGFSQDDILKCAAATQAYHLILPCDPAEIPLLYPAFQAVTLAVAEKMNGYIFDELAKIAITAKEYRTFIFSLDNSPLLKHVLVQRYAYEPGRFRIVTLGMAKFGCPEIEMRDFPSDKAMIFNHLICAVSKKVLVRSLNRKGDISFPSQLSLGPEYISNGPEKPIGSSDVAENSEDIVALMLEPGDMESGDPQENIVRIVPPPDFKEGMTQWAAAVSTAVVGFDVRTTIVQDIPLDLLERVQQSLPDFKQKFLSRKTNQEKFFVKIFSSAKGRTLGEFLVGRVEKWTDNKIGMLLISEPHLTKGISAGTRVELNQNDVKDWIYIGSDGKIEGFFTKEIEK